MAFFLFPMKEGERSLDIFKIAGRILIETEEAISALKETAKEAEEASESISDIDDEAKKTEKGTKQSSSGMVANFGKVAGAASGIVTAVIAIGKAIIEVADSTRDYRVEMAKLETAFYTAGHSADMATTTYQTLYSVLGETDQAIEAANMLARLCDTEEQLAEMTNACIGIYATFGNSLPVEGLAEAANETAKTGTVTGQLADALNWVGLSEADFNSKLSKCNTERERAALITQTMVAAYSEASNVYQENNKQITEAYLAQERLNQATARFGEVAEPIATSFINTWAQAVNGFAIMLEGLQPSVNDPFAQYSNLEEISARLDELIAKRDELNKVPILERTDEMNLELFNCNLEIAKLEERYYDLAGAQRSAVEEAKKLVEAMEPEAETFAKFTELTEQYAADVGALMYAFVATYEGIYSQVSGWYGLFDEASSSVTTNIEDMMSAMQSQIDFNNNYSANLQALKDYGLGSLSEAFQSYGKEGAAYAEAIVKAVEDAGGATTDEGQAIIQGFSDMNEQITSSQEELSQTMALLNGEFETELQKLNDNYEAAIEGLNLEAEAAEAAKFTMQGLLDGLEAQLPNITEKMGEIASEMKGSLQSGIGTIEIPYTFVGVNNPYGKPPGFKTGLDYVPYDEFPAMLHKGEAVLTAEEATAWRAGKESASSGTSGGTSSGSGSGVTVIQHITAVAQTPVELASATAAYFEQARWTL